MEYYSDQSFDKIIASQLMAGDYENCIFKNCDFSDFNFSGFKFSDCDFYDCNLSMAGVSDTAFRDVNFRDCKMLGLQLDQCNAFGFSVNVKSSVLNHSSFFQMDLRKCRFQDSIFHEVDFTEANLAKLNLENCDFRQSVFDHTNLDGANFKTALNFAINPNQNSIKKTKFSFDNISGLLSHLDIIID